MTGTPAPVLRARLIFAALLVLAIGLPVALGVYLVSDDVDNRILGYRVVDGVAYPILAGDSRDYIRQLEYAGGKANVLFDELGRWFASLWQGKRLGLTLGALSLLLAGGIYLYSRWLLPPAERKKP